MSNTPKEIYTARTETIGGRESGVSRSSDGVLDIRFSAPDSTGIGTNPEQLLSAAWSASLASAIAFVARKNNVALPTDLKISAEVAISHAVDGYVLEARMSISMPGIDGDTTKRWVDEARQICPFSKALSQALHVTVELD
ncbi:Ohr family peroxiredoxin [Rhizobium leguminosarum]